MRTGTAESGKLLSFANSAEGSSTDVNNRGKCKNRSVTVEFNRADSEHTVNMPNLPNSGVRTKAPRAIYVIDKSPKEHLARGPESQNPLLPSGTKIIETEVAGKIVIGETELVREELDKFIETMYFAFSKLEAELKGPVSYKEVLAVLAAYGSSVVNLSALIQGNYDDFLAWFKFIVAGFSAGAMYASAILSVVNDPVKLKEKLEEFKALPKSEKIKIGIFMTVVSLVAMYSPLLDATNAYDGFIKLIGGNVADPSTFHKVLGFMAGVCNWGAESILPILLGMRIVAGIESEIREIIYADKDQYETKCKMAKDFRKLVSLYNNSIKVNGDKNNLVLDVTKKEIISYTALLTQLNADPYLLEDVMKLVHGIDIPRRPVMGRVSGVVKVVTRMLVTGASGMGLSKVMAMPSILSRLGVSGSVDCAKLREKLKSVHIDATFESVKMHSYTAQGVTFVDNLSTFGSSVKVFPYAVSHSIKGVKNSYQLSRGRRGDACAEQLTTNGLKRIWRTIGTPLQIAGAIAGGFGVCVYTWVASGSINGAQNLGEATQCANVTIPGINADEVNNLFYTLLTYGAVVLLFFILLGGAPGAWMKMLHRAFPTKKGPKAITLAAHQRQRPRNNAENASDGGDADRKEPVSGRKRTKGAMIRMKPAIRASIEKSVEDKEVRPKIDLMKRWGIVVDDDEPVLILRESINEKKDGARREKQGAGVTMKKQDWTCTDRVMFKAPDGEGARMKEPVVEKPLLESAMKAKTWDESRVKPMPQLTEDKPAPTLSSASASAYAQSQIQMHAEEREARAEMLAQLKERVEVMKRSHNQRRREWAATVERSNATVNESHEVTMTREELTATTKEVKAPTEEWNHAKAIDELDESMKTVNEFIDS